MRSRKSIEIIAFLGAGVAPLVMFFSTCELPPRVDRELHTAIGRALAKEALSLSGPGGQITVIARDTTAFAQPTMDLLLTSFKREVQRAGAAVGAVQLVQIDPLRPIDVPPGDFFELIRHSKPGHVIVSLLGSPVLTEEQREKLGQVQAKIVAFCPGNLAEIIDLRALFKGGLLHAVVLSQPIALGSDRSAKTPRKFDQLYRIVQAADPSKLPSPLAAPSTL